MIDERLPKIKQRSNSLREEDCVYPTQEIIEYKVGDKVTRANLVSLLIKSFAISRGKPEIQHAFFLWLEKKYGFDYKTTLHNIESVGLRRMLSKHEKDKFIQAFMRVSKHEGNIGDLNAYSHTSLEKDTALFDSVQSELSRAGRLGDTNNRISNLESINSEADFARAVTDYLRP